MASVDLLDAFLLVPVHVSCRKFLRFVFEGRLYQFKVMPFDLATAPYVFTKIMKPVIGHLRSLGFISAIYLDDFLLIGQTFWECKSNVSFTLKLLKNLGFLVNRKKKSSLLPSTRCKFLGFLLDSDHMTTELPTERRYSLLVQVKNTKKRIKCKIREFSRLIGSLISACPGSEYGMAYSMPLEREKIFALK